jgi:succinylglutamate desuccinylase
VQNFLVLVDYSAVLSNAYSQVQLWLDALGDVLSKIANNDLEKVIKETQAYEEKLKSDV